MQADNSLIDYRRQRQPIEQIVDFVEAGVDIGGFLSQAATTLLSETEGVVDPFVFMIASEQVNFIREFDLECHQKTNRLQRMRTSVHIVAEEEIIVALDIAIIVGNTPEVEESHQILILPMDVAKDFDRCIDSKDHWLILEDTHALIGKRENVLPPEREVAIAVILGRPLSRSQQVGQE